MDPISGTTKGRSSLEYQEAPLAPMPVEVFPQADIAAALALLDETGIGCIAVDLTSSNAPVSGAAMVSHQNRGEVHATPPAASTRPSKRVRYPGLGLETVGVALETPSCLSEHHSRLMNTLSIQRPRPCDR